MKHHDHRDESPTDLVLVGEVAEPVFESDLQEGVNEKVRDGKIVKSEEAEVRKN